MTLEAIFNMEKLQTDSEKELVDALEKYIDNYKYHDPKIYEKIRPALNCIRFLTLPASNIARCGLLTAEEVRAIIVCLSEGEDLSKMPVGFSLNRKKRTQHKNTIKIGGNVSMAQRTRSGQRGYPRTVLPNIVNLYRPTAYDPYDDDDLI